MPSSIRKISLAAAMLSLAACAQGPDSIAPVSMGNAYTKTTCSQAQTLLSAERQTLDALSAKQRSAVTGDAIGVFLIAVPVSSLAGNDVSGHIATSKGKINALSARLETC